MKDLLNTLFAVTLYYIGTTDLAEIKEIILLWRLHGGSVNTKNINEIFY